MRMKENFKNVATIAVSMVVMAAIVWWLARGWASPIVGAVLGILLGRFINQDRRDQQELAEWRKKPVPEPEELDRGLWEEWPISPVWYLNEVCSVGDLQRMVEFYHDRILAIWRDESKSVEERMEDAQPYEYRLKKVNWHLERR